LLSSVFEVNSILANFLKINNQQEVLCESKQNFVPEKFDKLLKNAMFIIAPNSKIQEIDYQK